MIYTEEHFSGCQCLPSKINRSRHGQVWFKAFEAGYMHPRGQWLVYQETHWCRRQTYDYTPFRSSSRVVPCPWRVECNTWRRLRLRTFPAAWGYCAPGSPSFTDPAGCWKSSRKCWNQSSEYFNKRRIPCHDMMQGLSVQCMRKAGCTMWKSYKSV